MSELILYGLIILIAVAILVGIPFNIIKSKGVNKKVIIITNSILIAVLIAVQVSSKINDQMISNSTEGSKIKQYSFLSSMKYTGTEDGYHTFYLSVLMGGYDIAVPAGNIELPGSVKKGTNVVIAYKDVYTDRDDGIQWFSNKQQSIGSNNYYIADNVTGVFRDYTDLKIGIVLNSILILFLFNLTEFIIVIALMKKKE